MNLVARGDVIKVIIIVQGHKVRVRMHAMRLCYGCPN